MRIAIYSLVWPVTAAIAVSTCLVVEVPWAAGVWFAAAFLGLWWLAAVKLYLRMDRPLAITVSVWALGMLGGRCVELLFDTFWVL